VPTFCRHSRFIERCPICGPQTRVAPSGATSRSAPRRGTTSKSSSTAPANPRRGGLSVRHESRALDDGYRSALVPGLRSSQDAERLAAEIGFSAGRLRTLAEDPPGLLAEVVHSEDREQATWLCLLTVYLSPLQDSDPFAGVRRAATDWHSGELPDLEGVPLGPRTSHDPARGLRTLEAYRHWAERAGSQAAAREGDPDWSAARRFERVYERLALPGLERHGRYDLLVTLGHLGLYALRGDALHARGDDDAVGAAKRVFAIGDSLNLERRARALSDAAEVPIETLDLALANWVSPQRATLGVDLNGTDVAASERAARALGL